VLPRWRREEASWGWPFTRVGGVWVACCTLYFFAERIALLSAEAAAAPPIVELTAFPTKLDLKRHPRQPTAFSFQAKRPTEWST